MTTRRHLLGSPFWLLAGLSATRLSAQSVKSPGLSFATWADDEPAYRFYINDKIEVQIPGAPELNRISIVAPDGRITLAMIGQVMVAYRTVTELQAEISHRYSQYLRRPDVFVFANETTPMRVLIGGEVKNPGWVEMNGDMDALSAVLAAGGVTHAARTKKAVIIRRARDGRPMRQIIDLEAPIRSDQGRFVPLRRFDIVFVPRTQVAEAGVFVEQYINNLIPGALMNYFANRVFQ